MLWSTPDALAKELTAGPTGGPRLSACARSDACGAQVVFASLAITFLLEIDDQLMTTLCERIHHGPAHRAVLAGFRRALTARIIGSGGGGGRGGAAEADKIVKLWGFALVAGMAGLHLHQTLQARVARVCGLRCDQCRIFRATNCAVSHVLKNYGFKL